MEPQFYLECQDTSVELARGETVVGRDVGCKLRLGDPAVSRRHLRFVRRAGELFVEDLASHNGTLLNGVPLLAPTRLADGDALVVGARTLFVRFVHAEDVAAQTLTFAVLPPLRARGTQPVPVQPHVTQRRDARLPVELPLVYVSRELEIEATSRDLSTSGVFVVSPVLEPIGTTCKLTFLDGGLTLEVQGIVRRVVETEEAAGLGVEFSPLGATEKRWLEALVARLAR